MPSEGEKEPAAAADAAADETSSKVKLASNPLFDYLKHEHFIRQQANMFEEELKVRIEIVREHHTSYTKIVGYFVKVLNRCADESLKTAKRIMSPADVVANLHRDPHGMGAAEDDGDFDGTGQEFSPPPYRSVGGASSSSRSTSRKPKDESQRAARLIVMPASATEVHIQSTLELTARPQIHRKIIQERKMGLDLTAERRRLEKHAIQEERRTAAYMRKTASQIERTAASDAKIRHVKDPAKVKLDEERRMRVRREALAEKHHQLGSRTVLLELERQAASSAIRRLDDTSRKAIETSKQMFEDEMHRHAGSALAVQENAEKQRESTDKAFVQAKCTRHIANARFRERFDKEVESQQKGLHRDEHHAAVDFRKKITAEPAVEVRWPTGILRASRSPPRKTIGTDEYARLCGVREGVLSDSAKQLHVNEVDGLRHLAPQHWSLLKSTRPDPQWDAIQRVQASLLRGPTHVSWH